MYRTIPIRVKFTEEEKAYWTDQCRHANSLINCTIYAIKQAHYAELETKDNARSLYWRGDTLHSGWKLWRCSANYESLCKELKVNEHFRSMASTSAQQAIKSVTESITSYNGLVRNYYQNPAENQRPDSLATPKYRKKGGLAPVTFPRALITYREGVFYPPIPREAKSEMITEIGLTPPEFIDSDWVCDSFPDEKK